MYEYIQSIEEKTNDKWRAIDKTTTKKHRTEAHIANVKCHHKYHLLSMNHQSGKGLEQRGR